ncbi:transcriptional regulator [Paenibacillus sp. MSJ-34]|uniref:ArsR/SmtB family transcription factor n=1 Tax=Paenibacillus sp. MSJ-34 TaxID=2841529 RepID=UPI001C0FE292|nr:transcriptional regulator [Paenibacillus sp. MSJ-34]MBU5444884.1 helix-turn-helix domain-containing protein [Paenibacillus sp. MSJ-34]
MKRFMIIETPDQLKAISDPLRLEILIMLIRQEYTGKQVGDVLHTSASKIHYHLKEMERNGLLEVTRTEEKNGIVQKFYRAVAFDFRISEELLPSLKSDTTIIQETMLNNLRSAMYRLRHAPEESFLSFAPESSRPPVLHGNGEYKVPLHEIKDWVRKFKALVQEFEELESKYAERVQRGDAQDVGELFFFSYVGFMTNEQLYVSDEMSLPEAYEPVDDIVVRKKREEDRTP